MRPAEPTKANLRRQAFEAAQHYQPPPGRRTTTTFRPQRQVVTAADMRIARVFEPCEQEMHRSCAKSDGKATCICECHGVILNVIRDDPPKKDKKKSAKR